MNHVRHLFRKKTNALVLSGGGALGAAHIGALKVLERNGFVFSYYAGVSAGAIVASLSALGIKAEEMQHILAETKIFSLGFDITKNHLGMIAGNKIQHLFETLYRGKTFSDLKVPLIIGATDFTTGERIMIREGKISDAVRASMSVPIIFDPFYHPLLNRFLIDGGVSQNFPLDYAMKHFKGKKIIGIDVGGGLNHKSILENIEKNKQKQPSYRYILQYTLNLMMHAQQACFKHDRRVSVITPDLTGYDSFDVFKLDEIIKRGEAAAELMFY